MSMQANLTPRSSRLGRVSLRTPDKFVPARSLITVLDLFTTKADRNKTTVHYLRLYGIADIYLVIIQQLMFSNNSAADV